MAPVTRLTSTVYGHFSSRMPHETTAFASFGNMKNILSSFALIRLNLSDIHDWISSFALDPLSLLEFIVIFIAVCFTTAIAVIFINGLGPVRAYRVCLEEVKLPKSIDRNLDEKDVSYWV